MLGCQDPAATLSGSPGAQTGIQCTGDELPGTFCSDGTIYLGQNNGALYITTGAGCYLNACTGTEFESFRWATSSVGLDRIFLKIDSSDGALNQQVLEREQSPAALFCKSLSVGGHSDWYLPSAQEVARMSASLRAAKSTATNFRDQLYWSSTETGSISAVRVNWLSGTVQNANKASTNYVRCMRKIPAP